MTRYEAELECVAPRWPGILAQDVAVFGAALPSSPGSSVAVGSGCALPVAKLIQSQLQSRQSETACTRTPYEIATTATKWDCAFLVSAKGDHPDILSCFDALERRASQTIIITGAAVSPLVSRAEHRFDRTTVLCVEPSRCSSGFIPVESTLRLASAIQYLPFCGSARIGMDIFDDAVLDDEVAASSLLPEMASGVWHVISSQWGQSAALDFQTRMAEAGIGSVAITDPWNFGHGRYMPFHNQPGRHNALRIYTEGEELAFQGIDKDKIPLSGLAISAPRSGYLGAVYCLIRSCLLVGRLAKLVGVDPAFPRIPHWGDDLYLCREKASHVNEAV